MKYFFASSKAKKAPESKERKSKPVTKDVGDTSLHEVFLCKLRAKPESKER